MKRLFKNKLFIAVLFFCVGFFTNHLLNSFKENAVVKINDDRFPVTIDNFDNTDMMDTIDRLAKERAAATGADAVGEVSQREDDKNVYYEIPQKNTAGANHKLNVEIKDGMIKISEDLKSGAQNAMEETSSERAFSIDPSLDADKAEVTNEKDKIVIKIPKK